MRFSVVVLLLLAATVFAVQTSTCAAIDEFEQPPINYTRSTPNNSVSLLQAQLASGKLKLDYDPQDGYLRALLKALDVPVESQMLVFSKTSMQRRRISPQTPRAIYFNDNVYVGYCQSGDVLEISAADPQLGAVFYTVDQRDADKVHLVRQTEKCLTCHSSSLSGGIPGHVVRSLYADLTGEPIFSGGSRTVDHATPLADRWGGWYVTGTHGAQKHLGNLVISGNRVEEPVNNTRGQNVVQLGDRFAVDAYLAPHSDIVALMVLEHQTLVHNCLTKASYAVRQALHYEKGMNQALGNPQGTRLESTTARIQSAGDELVEALLLVGEAKLTAPIRGTSGYAEKFARLGPRDSQGRSLRDLDLKERLFKYPCSYLIYSPAFDQLPRETRDYVWKQLWAVLDGSKDLQRFGHLSPADRRAIVEIIRATKPDLPEYWRAKSVSLSSASYAER